MFIFHLKYIEVLPNQQHYNHIPLLMDNPVIYHMVSPHTIYFPSSTYRNVLYNLVSYINHVKNIWPVVELMRTTFRIWSKNLDALAWTYTFPPHPFLYILFWTTKQATKYMFMMWQIPREIKCAVAAQLVCASRANSAVRCCCCCCCCCKRPTTL